MGKTHRKRDIAAFRRFQRAMRTDTARKARKYRKREEHELRLAQRSLRQREHSPC